MPTLAILASKFRREINGEIADRIDGAASRIFGTLIQQYRDIEDVCVTNKKRKTREPEMKGASGSTTWKDRRFGGKGKGKQLSARQMPNQFKRTSTQQGCGKEGHYARYCPSLVARAIAVQASLLQMVPVPPTATPMVPLITGRVYSLDRQQLDKAQNLVRGIISIGRYDIDVLFDSRATYSFIKDPITVGLDLPMHKLSPPLRVTTATREKGDASSIYRDVAFRLDSQDYLVDLIYLPIINLEIILGIGWLSRNCAIDCYAKKVVMSPCDSPTSSSLYLSVFQARKALRVGAYGYAMLGGLMNGTQKDITGIPVERLTIAPVLILPDPAEQFELCSDVSKKGLGCMLMETCRVVAYASRQLKPHEEK
ncbi:uncharacterized protein LOC133310739 [Gastrolobium bilobum]|uniref:uncharacterized protein LOC133310739 n=1 Tax=Gastrolobium bilobum TaxID=150636 RepID=UPI002AB0F5E7|nr:uncharacterized protein LOC133310739 [Gastrolobium bilobum]